MKRVLFTFAICLCLFGITAGEDVGQITDEQVDILKGKQTQSEFFTLKKTVHLDYPVVNNETRKIKNFKNFQINDDYILGMDKNKRCWLWGINGEFIGQVGNLGKGPGEYIRASVIALLSNHRIGIFDGRRKVFIEYKVNEHNIEIVNTYDLSYMVDIYPHKMMETADGYIFAGLHGLKGGYKFFITDKTLKLQKRLAKRRRDALGLCLYNVLFSENRIIYTDDFIGDKYASSTLFVMEYDGILLRKIHFPEKEAAFFYMDKNSGLILGSGAKEMFIVDLTGRVIHKFKKRGEIVGMGIGPTVFTHLGIFTAGDCNEFKITLGVDCNDNLVMRIEEIEMF